NKHTLIPSLLALSAVHHHLLLMGLRAKVSLIVDSGEPRSTHDCAALISYGASAICPYSVLSSLPILLKEDANNIQAELNLVTALEKGLLKIMSKIGISTIDSYCGAQTFECIGLANEVVEKYFCGTPSSLGGATLKDIARISLVWHALAYGNKSTLSAPGYYKYKRRGELHGFAPKTVKLLHSAVHTDDILNGNFASGYKKFSEFTQYVSEQPPIHIRDLLAIKPLPYAPLSLSEIESREHIIKRFSVAAMSLGSISSEVHETLAVAMNKLGAHSNSGEGGELPSRYYDNRNSRIKQIASGRFGVTPAYIMSADELQIKIAQGAKPGEGGQLPAHKVTAEISTIRHARVGTLLISPPPHHDIYSIEDLAQLIFDL
ncbi:MAG: glutamate synthase-related protein, partial [Chloroflexota bacterium]|nr:glutamate synthase-related protein [Chloroflexota bacterium]